MSQFPDGHDPLDQQSPNTQAQEAYRLQQEEARLLAARRQVRFAWVRNTITLLVSALQILLAMRFFLRLSVANPDNVFARTIYTLAEPFMRPFSTLFISPTNADASRIFDLNNLIAMVIYALLGSLAVALVNYLQGPSPQR